LQQSNKFKRDTAAVIKQRYGDFKQECFPRPSGGCSCNVKDPSGVESVKSFAADADCKDPSGVESVKSFAADADCKVPIEDVLETALKKQEVNEQIKEKFGDFKENCFPKPSGGCRCNEKDANGNEVVARYDSEADCKVPLLMSVAVHTAENKKKVNEEIKQKFGAFKENCFPRPSGGCSCNEKDAHGKEVVAKYNSDAECKLPARMKRTAAQRPSQNVRDPVREKAQANYAAVVNELNEKFKGLKEGCFPRPKGCLCVIGKDKNGRDITERRMKDKDCKCQPGERGKGCPVGGA
uniref:Thyroglobulin type-1 domain-containing protein n=1 Tax=Ascaris lumbricoides TaxID=6252 RepID=A0A0M3ICK0_ASCLU